MPTGPGKYDKWCLDVLLEVQADATVLIVLNGVLGSGFSVNATSPVLTKRLPDMLRMVANEIEQSL
jgi:hypothetical protein